MQDSYDLHKECTSSVSAVPDIKKTLNQGQVALDELSRILEKMKINAQVFYHEKREAIYLEIRGPNLGLIIGKHGQTLDALEFILNAIHRKRFSEPKPLVLDAQGYRDRKKSILKKIVYEAREKAIKSGCDILLEPMSPSDRKLVHLICGGIPGLRSESRGEGGNRRVIIILDEKESSGFQRTLH
jgi:spoIIIJ-associated protein